MLVFTQDSTVKANLTHRVERVRKRSTEIARELTGMHLARVGEVHARLEAKGHTTIESKEWLAGAKTMLAQADSQAALKNEQQAFYHLRRCDQLLRHVERDCWEQTLAPVTAPLATALGTNFDTLPEYWQFMGEIGSAQRGPNLLPAANFEDLQAALNAGWRYFQHPQPTDLQHPQPPLTTSVTASDEVVHEGKYAVRLAVTPANPEQPPAQVETAPMWLASAPVPVEAGRIAVIHFWANVPKRIAGSVDGLLVLDSMTGEPLAERIMQTSGWQEYTLYRAIPRSGTLTLTFALSGLGEAFLDDVSVQMVDRPATSSKPPTTPAQATGLERSGARPNLTAPRAR
jgi:hypothetical protein